MDRIGFFIEELKAEILNSSIGSFVFALMLFLLMKIVIWTGGGQYVLYPRLLGAPWQCILIFDYNFMCGKRVDVLAITVFWAFCLGAQLVRKLLGLLFLPVFIFLFWGIFFIF